MRQTRRRHSRLPKALLLPAALAVWEPGQAQPGDSVPTWLDTIPPRVTVTPERSRHNKVFHVTFGADEVARILVGIDTRSRLTTYRRPISITTEGAVTIYFRAEDDFGNSTELDSVTYVLDTRKPQLVVSPADGFFRRPVTVRLKSNEPCRYFFHRTSKESPGKALPHDSLVVRDSLTGVFSAVDSAGNRTFGEKVRFVVDTTRVSVWAVPNGGAFADTSRTVAFETSPAADVFYSFDPLAPSDWFERAEKPLRLPYGHTTVRFYARAAGGATSEIIKADFLIDTLPPRIRVKRREGTGFDTLKLSTREPSTIYFTLDGSPPTEQSAEYGRPVPVKRKFRCLLKARAVDRAGNVSGVITREFRYDTIPPVVRSTRPGGTVTEPVTVALRADEPGKIFYTLDGSEPTTGSRLYAEPITISREGRSVITFMAVDRATNTSRIDSAVFVLDSRPPTVRAAISRDIDADDYEVTLWTDEKATVYYEKGDRTPSRASPVYSNPLRMHTGGLLRYFAVDSAGNRGKVYTLDELRRPMVSATPGGGMYNRRLSIGFVTNMPSRVYWRFPPDTAYTLYKDSLEITTEGVHTLEYYCRTSDGARSPVHRNEFMTDWTPPRTDITLRRNPGDSVSVFFESSENAGIYYTLNGASPLVSESVRSTGDKFRQSSAAVRLRRTDTTRLAWYAEDLAGNRSSVRILDLSTPRAVPNVPAGPDRVYDRPLSISFSTLDRGAHVVCARHGTMPSVNARPHIEPITLTRTDTIIALVIDASGYHGQPDTFIYQIDLPPAPRFSVSPATLSPRVVARFDARATSGAETPEGDLRFRWDFEGDGTFDTPFSPTPTASHTYKRGGLYAAMLEVKDGKGRVADAQRNLRVLQRCPPGMVFIPRESGRSFCIDRYEWPNVPRKVPGTGVTWVEARMLCEGVGKHLCTRREWLSACAGTAPATYPYGNQYDPEKCATTGEKLRKTGSFSSCGEPFGLRDMVGNAWEWVDDKEGDYPLMMGGSFRFGPNARCEAASRGTIASSADDIGFRCCR